MDLEEAVEGGKGTKSVVRMTRGEVAEESSRRVGGGRKEKFPLLLSEWILQLSSGECTGIPQSLLLKNAVIPIRSNAELTYARPVLIILWPLPIF